MKTATRLSPSSPDLIRNTESAERRDDNLFPQVRVNAHARRAIIILTIGASFQRNLQILRQQNLLVFLVPEGF